jgi:hypothetical protein
LYECSPVTHQLILVNHDLIVAIHATDGVANSRTLGPFPRAMGCGAGTASPFARVGVRGTAGSFARVGARCCCSMG